MRGDLLVPPVFATVPPSLMTLPPLVGPAKPEYELPPGPLPLPRPPSASPVVESPERAPVSKNLDQHMHIGITVRLHTCAGTSVGDSSIIVGDVDDITTAGTAGGSGISVTTASAVVVCTLPDSIATKGVTTLRGSSGAAVVWCMHQRNSHSATTRYSLDVTVLSMAPPSLMISPPEARPVSPVKPLPPGPRPRPRPPSESPDSDAPAAPAVSTQEFSF